jgi:hypothetical protein
VPLIYEFLRWLNFVLIIGTFILYFRRQRRHFPWFGAFLLLDSVLMAASLILKTSSPLYCTLYLWSRPLCVLLRTGATWEIFSSLFEQYRGLRVLARGGLTTSVLASVLVAAATIPATRSSWGCPAFQCYLFAFAEAERCLLLALAVFTLGMTVVLWRLSLRLTYARMAHALIWSVRTVLISAILLIVLTDDNRTFRLLCNIAILTVSATSNLAWMALVGRNHVEEVRQPDADPLLVEKLCNDLSSFQGVLENLTVRVADRSSVPRSFPLNVGGDR